jgi:predicted transcriptional regulator
MKSTRLNIYLDPDLAGTLDLFALQRQLNKSAVVANALAEYFSPDSEQVREATISKRFDYVSRQVEKVEHDLAILTEATAIYIRYYLSVVAPVPDSHQEAARAQGKRRFQQFIDQLARHLQRGNSLARDLHDQLYPDQGAYAQAAALDTQADTQADTSMDILP